MTGTHVPAELVGAWKLVDWYMDGGSGSRIEPFGPDATGFLVYTSSGHMSVSLMEPGRPPLDSEPIDVAVLKHQLSTGDVPDDDRTPMMALYFRAAAGYMNYAGTFEVQGDLVRHHVTFSLYPEWVGTDLDRRFTLIDGVLSLSGDAGGLIQHLVWERAGP